MKTFSFLNEHVSWYLSLLYPTLQADGLQGVVHYALDILGVWSLYYFGKSHAKWVTRRAEDPRYDSSSVYAAWTLVNGFASIWLLSATILAWIAVLGVFDRAIMTAFDFLRIGLHCGRVG